MNELMSYNINGLPSVKNFSSYKNYVFGIPNLTEEEETTLLKKFKLENCLKSAQELILSQLKTVVNISYQFRNYGISEEDLVQEGNIGLMKAVKNFDISHKVRLYSYAVIWIKSEMQAYILKNWKLVKIGTTKNLKKLFFNFKSIQKELISSGVNKNNIPLLISQKLNIDIKDVYEIEQYFSSDDVTIDMDNEDNPILQIGHNKTPELDYMNKHDTEKNTFLLNEAMKVLNEKQKKVIQMRFYDETKKTHKEIGEILGVSSERIRQIEVEAMSKMKKVLIQDFSMENTYI